MNKSQAAYDLLRARIIDGTYGPGYPLIIEHLARDSGISAIPWREAVRRLEAQGWVEIVHNIGARVALFEQDALTQTVDLLARLEGLATARALLRLTPAQLDEARAINDSMIAALDDFVPTEFTAMNRDFHFVFYDHCADARLRELIANEWSRLEVIRRPLYALAPGRAEASVEEHRHLLELLATRDPARGGEVEQAALQHKLASLHAVTDAPPQSAEELSVARDS